ncbi:MAG: DUF1579 family protein [Dehalococcoidia bacterium]|nr:DUF1579 family protein [Dehalococcoidia bacterium]
MPALEPLAQLAGVPWAGRSSLWFQPDTPAFESSTTAMLTTVAGGKVVTLDYTWSHEGAPHDGRLLIAATAEGTQMAWCDSFHMDANLMVLSGPPASGVFAATGSYSEPGGEPWGWRIEVEPRSPQALVMRMFNILPASMGGIEALAVLSEYAPAS